MKPSFEAFVDPLDGDHEGQFAPPEAWTVGELIIQYCCTTTNNALLSTVLTQSVCKIIRWKFQLLNLILRTF